MPEHCQLLLACALLCQEEFRMYLFLGFMVTGQGTLYVEVSTTHHIFSLAPGQISRGRRQQRSIPQAHRQTVGAQGFFTPLKPRS